MKDRKNLIQQCRYPFLPKNSFSLSRFLSGLKNKTFPLDGEAGFWLGGSLTDPIDLTGFSLNSQFQTIKCFVSKTASLFFDFNKEAKNYKWSKVFSHLRPGDHLLLYIQNPKQKYLSPACRVLNKSSSTSSKPHLLSGEIKNIQKLVLLSVNKKPKNLHSDFFVAVRHQADLLEFLNTVHKALKKMGLKQVSTPCLIDSPGTELDMFETQFYSPRKEKSFKKLFLITSPEINMKRMICQGYTDIYEITKCFRNKELGPTHHLEFYLLEWYRAYASLNALIKDLKYLLNFLSQKTRACQFPPLRCVSVQKLFHQHVGMTLSPVSSKKDFALFLNKKNIPFKKSASTEDLFHLLFLNEIEPKLDPETPFIVYNYPVFQKAYARIGPKGWAFRFELFWKGMELANAFDEVIEDSEQKQRFIEEQFNRQKTSKPPVPFSRDLLKNMRGGMPPSAGIALGLDRLFLAFKGLHNINQTKLF